MTEVLLRTIRRMAVGLGLELVLLGVALAHRIVDALDEPVGVVAHPRLRVANGEPRRLEQHGSTLRAVGLRHAIHRRRLRLRFVRLLMLRSGWEE
jgi:hypothetical protein